MCGLISVFKKNYRKHTGSKVIELYEAQKKRGSEGFGYIAIKDNKIVNIKRSKNDKEIKSLLSKEKADHILFHHRKPTSTENTIGTTHPIFVSNPELEFDYYFAHNGVIRNTDRLKEVHEKLEYVYTTEHTKNTYVQYKNGDKEMLSIEESVHNDSESLAIELARYIDGKVKDVGAVGAIAFWGLSFNKETNEVNEVYFGKNYGRELSIQDTNKFYSISSETGVAVKEMYVFSFKLDDKFSFEQMPLPVNEDRKESTTYHRPYYNHPDYKSSDRVYNFLDPKDEEVYNIIPNYYYTLDQKNKLSLPNYVWVNVNLVNRQMLNKHIGVNIGSRNNISDSEFDELFEQVVDIRTSTVKEIPPATEEDVDELQKLEEMAVQYAEKRSSIDAIDFSYNKGYISEHTRDMRVTRLENDCTDLEAKMYLTNISTSIVDDLIETALEMADYNDSYNVNNDDEQIAMGFNRNVAT